MKKPVVSIIRYTSSPESLAEALMAANAFDELDRNQSVLIKPNLVGWDPVYPLAPYAVYTTSRLVEDMVILLKDYGIGDITIGEGSSQGSRSKAGTLKGAKLVFKALGYDHLNKKYSVKLVDFFEEPFQPIEVGGFTLNFAEKALETDFLINMPVLKTHSQTVFSLGFKNLKGCIDMKSRKFCHNREVPLDFFCALFPEVLRPCLTVLDGIYGLEKGPYFLGNALRMNLVVASKDPLAVEMIGTMVAGHNPSSVEHLSIFAERQNRSMALDEIIINGLNPEEVKRYLKNDFSWREDNTGPSAWDKIGISGIKIPKYDKTLCTGCSSMFNVLVMLITSAYKGKPFDGIEVLTGKSATPSPGFNRTILFGNCMIKKNRNHPSIKKAHYIKGCPVVMEEIIGRLGEFGIEADLEYFARFRKSLAGRYDGNPDFEPEHYFMPGATGAAKANKVTGGNQ
jgi:uncharacterized protein (DUF362 family)